ncbi:dihydrolipoamide succinyltransferase [Sphingomonas ginkgonis]|uniref:Dihydrolipoamide acetyltransferase component of pyruvate dehydrogenase complex n=1 Tax=Sphingomonas ginkgonis TaxID=2315330 RepID=A0A429VAF1_9SPHN|nr:2-oxo acid dehydrogenase subunit E2 [Sphingomonas ginkgonis]RST30924.1 dihydrolipoamide succinyltransferase [Sphingomonas ginkgonis]
MAELIDVVMPLELEGTKAVVRSWLKQVGERVARDEPLVELETDKVTSEVSAPADGVLAEILLDSDCEAGVGALLGRLSISTGEETSAATAAPEPMGATRLPTATDAQALRLSPAVRKAVAEHRVDPRQVQGTGRNGRITRADVEAFAAGGAGAPSPSTAPSAPPSAPAQGSTIVPHDRMRRLIADNVLGSLTTAPHVTAVFEADFSRIVAHRAANRRAFEEQGVALTYTAYFVAAAVAAMKAAPAVNSRWHADHLELFADVNIGIGTALGDKGLIVPVVHGADRLSLLGIAARLQDVTARARSGDLKAGDLKDATFAISNHGVSGSLLATPIIIQQPQSAILGIGKLEKRVVVREVDGHDTIQIRPMSYVTLTIDHRVVDGHQTNAWLSAFVAALENWSD